MRMSTAAVLIFAFTGVASCATGSSSSPSASPTASEVCVKLHDDVLGTGHFNEISVAYQHAVRARQENDAAKIEAADADLAAALSRRATAVSKLVDQAADQSTKDSLRDLQAAITESADLPGLNDTASLGMANNWLMTQAHEWAPHIGSACPSQ